MRGTHAQAEATVDQSANNSHRLCKVGTHFDLHHEMKMKGKMFRNLKSYDPICYKTKAWKNRKLERN